MSSRSGPPRAACRLHVSGERVLLECGCAGRAVEQRTSPGDPAGCAAALRRLASGCAGPVTAVLPAGMFRAVRLPAGMLRPARLRAGASGSAEMFAAARPSAKVFGSGRLSARGDAAVRWLARAWLARALGVPAAEAALSEGPPDPAGRARLVAAPRRALDEAAAFIEAQGFAVAAVEPEPALFAPAASGGAFAAGAARLWRRAGPCGRSAGFGFDGARRLRDWLAKWPTMARPRGRSAALGGVAAAALIAAVVAGGGRDTAPHETLSALPVLPGAGPAGPAVTAEAPGDLAVPQAQTAPSLALPVSDAPRRRAEAARLAAPGGDPLSGAVKASRTVPDGLRAAARRAEAAAASEARVATFGPLLRPRQPADAAPAAGMNAAPAGMNAAPAGMNAAPAGMNAAPAGMNAAPAGMNAAPAGVNTAPAGLNVPPAGAGASGPRPMPRAAVRPAGAAAPPASAAADGRPARRPVDPAARIERAIAEAIAEARPAPPAAGPPASSAVASLRPAPRALAPVPQVARMSPVAPARPAVAVAPQAQQTARAPQPSRPAQQTARVPQAQAQAQAARAVQQAVPVPQQPARQVQAARPAQPAPQPQQVARVEPPRQAAPAQSQAPAQAPAQSQAPAQAQGGGNLTLIGVFGTAGQRHALVRLPSGAVQRVRPGETVAGVQIAAVGPDRVQVRANGRDGVLRLPD